MSKKITAGLLALSLIINTTGCVKVEKTEISKTNENTEISEPVKNIRAQDDFYGYVNKDTLDNMEINYTVPNGKAYTTEVEEEVNSELFSMMTEIVSSSEEFERGSNKQLVRDLYRQTVDYLENKDDSAVKHFREISERIRNAENIDDIKKNIKMLLEDEGITFYFNACVSQNYYDGNSYSLFLSQCDETVGTAIEDIYKDDDVRQKLYSFAVNVLAASGDEPETAKKKANDFVYFIIDISFNTDYKAMHSNDPFIERKFKTNEELNDILSGNITADELSEIYDLENVYGGWMIYDEQQLRHLAENFCDENTEMIKTWMLCDIMYRWKEYLKDDYAFLENCVGELRYDNDFLAALSVNDLLSTQVSELYNEYYYTEEMNELIHKMYDDVVNSYREIMNDAKWLTEETRERLIRKLENMYFISGDHEPHKINENDAELIGTDAFDSMRRINVSKQNEQRKNIGTKIDKTRPIMDSFTVNAAYSPDNRFMIPTGIMKAPFFDVNADYAENIGGLGMIMSHEIGHAFDSDCILYDENGAYSPEGICEKDREELAERLKKIEDYYSGFSIMNIYYVDGEKTSGENYADKGAAECIVNIIKDDEGRKKMFENMGKIFMALKEDNYGMDALQEDVHSPEEVRINAVLSSTDEFYELYNVQPGDKMYVAPEKRVSRYK